MPVNEQSLQVVQLLQYNKPENDSTRRQNHLQDSLGNLLEVCLPLILK